MSKLETKLFVITGGKEAPLKEPISLIDYTFTVILFKYEGRLPRNNDVINLAKYKELRRQVNSKSIVTSDNKNVSDNEGVAVNSNAEINSVKINNSKKVPSLNKNEKKKEIELQED
jgi:hypothetical protein